MNLSSGTEPRKAVVAWQPIRLRVVGEKILTVKETFPRELRLALAEGISLDLVQIPAGDFLMGSPRAEDETTNDPNGVSRSAARFI